MNSSILWIVYMVVAGLIIIRAEYIGFKLARYISKNHPKLYVLYRSSRGHNYPWNLFSRRMMGLIAKDDIGDPALIRLVKKTMRATLLTILWLFIAPIIILLIYIVFF